MTSSNVVVNQYTSPCKWHRELSKLSTLRGERFQVRVPSVATSHTSAATGAGQTLRATRIAVTALVTRTCILVGLVLQPASQIGVQRTVSTSQCGSERQVTDCAMAQSGVVWLCQLPLLAIGARRSDFATV